MNYTKISKETEIELIARLKNNDISAAEKIIESIYPLAYLLAKQISRHPSEIEDLRQEAIICILKSLQTFDPTLGKLTTYVGKVIKWELPKLRPRVNDLITRPQKKIKFGPKRKEFTIDKITHDSNIAIFDNADEKEYQVKLLKNIVKELPKNNQIVINLLMDNFSRLEIAKKLNKSYDSIRHLEERSIDILREKINSRHKAIV
jgi:RNA polymerase sigma factor (sigma-70 family)